jgi:undecaprenyl diphosphate synthase
MCTPLNLHLGITHPPTHPSAHPPTHPSASSPPQLLSSHLSTRCLPPNWRQPDLIIRTGGERRLSNFLLFEGAYAELVFVDAAWPDFGERELEAAVGEFGRRQRRYGRR